MKKLLVFFLLISCSTPAKDTEGMIEVNGTSLYYHMIGKGEPVIVIHGGPVLDQSYMFEHFKLLAKDHLLIFYDQRVCGKSSIDVDTSSVTMKNMIEDIAELRKKLSLDKVHILGHSWGGMLAAKYASEYPLFVKSLILCDAMPPTERLWMQEEIEIDKRTSRYDSAVRQSIMESQGFKNKDITLVDSLMKLSFKIQFTDTTKLSQLKIKLPKDYFQRSKIFFRLGPELYSYDIREQLKHIISATLIIYGDQEPAVNISAPVYKENIPDSRIVIIPRSGHFPFIEQPIEFKKVVEEFWKSVK
jgi:proline iminopeptidase